MSNINEATARIKINRMLERAGWRFFPEGGMPANVRLEPNVEIKQTDLDTLGDDFEKTSNGFIDFLLLDSKGFPLLVLEAKSEEKQPLVGKEQGAEVRPLSKLPVCHPFQRESALLLGPRAG